MTTIDDAVEILDRGGVVVMPTETVYGLVAKPEHAAISKIYEIKGRPADKSLQLLIGDASWLEKLARPCPEARMLADAFWPGPLTLVVPASDDVPPAVRKDAPFGAPSRSATVGLRQPAHPVALDLLARTGPLAASSANRSGEPTAPTVDQIRNVFGSVVDGYLDGGYIDGAASTVVAVAEGRVTFLRVGVLSEAFVKSALRGSI